jgi:DNA-binding transcriptional LysR family regulator
VSKRVAQLEERLGARLLHRSTRRVRPTEEGAAYYERCIRIVHEAEAADRALVDRAGAPRGLVRVTAPTAMGGFLGPVAIELLRTHPGISLEIVLIDRRVDLIQEGFDLAIRAGPLRDSSLVARRLGVSERCLVASPAYVAAHAAPKRPAELRKHQCIVSRTGPGPVEWTLERGRRRIAIAVDGRLGVSTTQLAREAALAGLGIANLPRFTVKDDLAAKRLVLVLPDWPPRKGEIHLLYAGGQHLSPRVRALIDLSVAWFAARR